MPASLTRIRNTMKVAPTSRDKGLKLTLTVVAYDNGMVVVDGIPMSDPESGWVDAAEVLVTTLNEFRRQASKRKPLK
ncbi:MAG: hypothetical protein Q7K37_06835 [Dehalococcoidia bacterium]|nr:hypothetical protein [Dehalococcoidia bacterium]